MDSKPDPSDLSDWKWLIVEPLLPQAKRYERERKQKSDRPEIVKAILLVLSGQVIKATMISARHKEPSFWVQPLRALAKLIASFR